MFKEVEIAPSILSADFIELGKAIDMVADAGAAYVHVDVMDGHFVPNLTMGIPIVRQLAKKSPLPLDVHLMVDNPLEELPWFLSVCDSPESIFCVHAEVLDNREMHEAIELIHDSGAKAAVALRPPTPVEVIEDVIDKLDMVLIMSVEPGFSGQEYHAGSEKKVAQVVQMAKREGVSPLIEVDGGISTSTAPLVSANGADVLVCGNAIFASEDPASALKQIKAAAEDARLEALK